MKTFEIPYSDKPGRLYVECCPSNGDTTFVKLGCTVPVGKKQESESFDGADVSLSVGDERVELKPYSSSEKELVMYCTTAFGIGDKLRIDASAASYPSVSSVSVIPEPPVFSLDRDENIFILTFKKNADGSSRYYGVKARVVLTLKDVSMSTGEILGYEERDYDFLFEPEGEFASESDNVTGFRPYVTMPVNGRDMYIFVDDGFRNDIFKLSVYLDMLKDRDIVSQGVKTIRRSYGILSVYSMDKQTYEYMNPHVNPIMVAAGLVPPFIPFGNIKGGYGIFSAMGKSETERLPNAYF